MKYKIIYKIVSGKDIVPQSDDKNSIDEKAKYLNRLGEDEWELIAIYNNFVYFKKKVEDKEYDNREEARKFGMT